MFVKPHLIQTNKAGVTIIELLIYISLLSMLVTVVFSFVWQIHRKNKNILISHTQLHVMQLAIDLLGRDLRNSNKIIINQKNQTGLEASLKTGLICQNNFGQVSWFFNQEHTLLRLDQQTKIKQLVPAKVVEDLKSFGIRQTKLKSGAIMMKLKLVDNQQNIFEKKVLLRSSMPL